MSGASVNSPDRIEEALAAVREALDGGVPLLHREDRMARRNTAERALDSLGAALREAQEWMTPFDGSGIEWHETDRSEMQHYPFPLSNGQVGILMLPPPWSLSEVDAERLADFVDALTGPPPHPSRQETA